MNAIARGGRQFHTLLILGTLVLSSAAYAQTTAPLLGELEKIAKAYKIEVVTADPGFPV